MQSNLTHELRAREGIGSVRLSVHYGVDQQGA